MVGLIPFFILSDHRVQDGQQFAHTGNQSHFFGFSSCKQTHVKGFYYRIKTGCDKRGHIQRGSYARPASKNGSSASHGTRVPIDWSNTYKRTDCSS